MALRAQPTRERVLAQGDSRATEGGISRIKDGHVATLTSANGLACDTIHGTMWDDSGGLWAYAQCGLIRIARTQLETWIAHPTRRIETTFWDAADGVQLLTAPPSSYGPFVARSADGKLWFVGTEGIQVVDPHRLSFNTVRPPVYVERLIAGSRRAGMRCRDYASRR